MIGVVLVHYHAPEVAREALAALREDLHVLGEPFDAVVVDNGSTPAGRRIVDELPARIVRPGENLGYAGGINLGVREVRGDRLMLMNPDVIVRPQCCAELLASLDGGAAVAGPSFFWDRGRALLLPPQEERSRRAELLARLAPSAEAAARLQRRRWRRHVRRHWEAAAPVASESLSGALLAVRRSIWEEIGPFDERYRLYYEETDWLRRLVRAGRSALYVPAAQAVHLYDRSASTEPRSAAWFEDSRRRFERRWYGPVFRGLLAAAERLPRRTGSDPSPVPGAKTSPTIEFDLPAALEPPLWVEVSPGLQGVPAAAEHLGPAGRTLRWRLPDEIWERLPSGLFRVQVTDARALEGPVRWLRKIARPADPRCDHAEGDDDHV